MTSILLINPFTPKSDQHLKSPYNITPKSHIKAIRIKEMVSNQRSFGLLILLVNTYGEYAYWY